MIEEKFQSLGDGCLDGYKRHKYSTDGTCERCGIPQRTVIRRNLNGTQPKTSTTQKTTKVEPSISKSDARDGLAMILLAAQTVIISQRPDLKEDALTLKERVLLADALTDEAFESTMVRRYLAKLGQQKKHAKLGMVLMAIALPRLARRGLIPSESGELTDELITQANTPAGFSRDTSGESEPEWDSVPVAAGGSPFINRGNGIGENDISGLAPETAPIRDSVENENGRREVSNGRDREISLSDEEFEIKPNRVKTGSSSHRSKKG